MSANPVLLFIDAVNRGDLDSLTAALYPDFEMVVPQQPSRNFVGRDQEVKNMAHMISSHPDGRIELVRMVEAGDEVWLESTFTAHGLEMAAAVIFEIDRGTNTIKSGRYYSDAVDREGPGIDQWIEGLGERPAEVGQAARQAESDRPRRPRLGRCPATPDEGAFEAYRLGRHPALEDAGRRTLMWSPELQKAQAHLAERLRNATKISPRERELAVLRHAADSGTDFEWSMHRVFALEAGLTPGEVERVRRPLEEGHWTSHEHAILRAVDELDSTSSIGDETWAALSENYDERQLVEFLMLVGHYRMLAYLFKAVGIGAVGDQASA